MKTLALMSTVAAAAVIAPFAPALPATSAPATSAPATSAPARTAPAPAVRECRNADLLASYRGGDAATSHVYGRVVLTNTSRRTCSVRGFGGLSYVGGGDGSQVGAAATRDTSTPVRTVVLAPGERARSAVSETSTGPYDAATCHPVPVDGFRVYVPDSRSSQFVAHPTTGCASTDVDLLSHRAFRG